MCNNLSGISLVLFFSKQCVHCGDVFPIFTDLHRSIPGCKFAVLNISMYPSVAMKSQQTIAPITHVPFIILYVNGRPFMKYNGKRTYQDLYNFVGEVLSRIQNKKSVSSGGNNNVNQMKMEDGDSIPEYVGGVIPFNVHCDENQCYLTFNEAYKKH